MSTIASGNPQNSYAATHVALPLDKELVMKVIPMPADCNANGDIFGGWVFKQPVRVGDILSFFSVVVRVGKTSVTVKVEVFAERFRSQGSYIKVTEALVTYVAIDDHGRPRDIAKKSD